MNKIDVIGLGSVLTDDLVLLPTFPEADSKVEIIKTQKQLGGPVPIALKTLSKLGLKTSFIGKIGDDSNSNFINNNEWCQSHIDVDGSPVKYGGFINAKQGFRNVTSIVEGRLTLSGGSDLKIRFRNNCAYDKWTSGGVSSNSLIIIRVF